MEQHRKFLTGLIAGMMATLTTAIEKRRNIFTASGFQGDAMKSIFTTVSAILCITVCCARAELSRDQIDRITSGLQEYKSIWTTQNTVNLLTRSDQSGSSTFTMTTDSGEEIAIEVVSGETVFIDGKDVGDAEGTPVGSKKPRSRLIYVCVALSFLLCLSVLLNVHLIRRQGRRLGYGKTDVINSISRL